MSELDELLSELKSGLLTLANERTLIELIDSRLCRLRAQPRQILQVHFATCAVSPVSPAGGLGKMTPCAKKQHIPTPRRNSI
jgi:hypothetical protein